MNHPIAALRQYQQVKTSAAMEGASPHRLIQMLFEGALERIAVAKGHIQRGEIAQKGIMISKTIDIIGGLREGLNEEAGGDIASNLAALYEYMEHRLLQANLESNPAILDEVGSLLREIKGAWDGIGNV